MKQLELKKIKKNKFVFIILFTYFLLIILFILFPLKTNSITSNAKNGIIPSEIIENNKEYKQKITCNIDNVKRIGLTLSTYGIKNDNGKIKFKVINHSSNNNYEKTIDLKDINDNEKVFLDFDKEICNKNENIDFILSYSDYYEGDSLAYWFKSKDISNKLLINNEEKEQEMQLFLDGKENNTVIFWYLSVITTFLLMYLCVKGDKNE